MTRFLETLAVSAVVLATAAPAAADVYRLNGPDGTVHYTNAPTDPRYRRVAGLSGSQNGWLRLTRSQVSRYGEVIRRAAERYGVPERLVSSVIRAESAFNPWAVSDKGARGLMQLMPETASMLGVRNAFDPRQNIDGGVRHLRKLMDRYRNNLPLVLAAYNAGERAVERYRGIPPFPETREYVSRVLAYYDGTGGLTPLPNAIYRRVEADGTITYTNIPPAGRR